MARWEHVNDRGKPRPGVMTRAQGRAAGSAQFRRATPAEPLSCASAAAERVRLSVPSSTLVDPRREARNQRHYRREHVSAGRDVRRGSFVPSSCATRSLPRMRNRESHPRRCRMGRLTREGGVNFSPSPRDRFCTSRRHRIRTRSRRIPLTGAIPMPARSLALPARTRLARTVLRSLSVAVAPELGAEREQRSGGKRRGCPMGTRCSGRTQCKTARIALLRRTRGSPLRTSAQSPTPIHTHVG